MGDGAGEEAALESHDPGSFGLGGQGSGERGRGSERTWWKQTETRRLQEAEDGVCGA